MGLRNNPNPLKISLPLAVQLTKWIESLTEEEQCTDNIFYQIGKLIQSFAFIFKWRWNEWGVIIFWWYIASCINPLSLLLMTSLLSSENKGRGNCKESLFSARHYYFWSSIIFLRSLHILSTVLLLPGDISYSCTTMYHDLLWLGTM